MLRLPLKRPKGEILESFGGVLPELQVPTSLFEYVSRITLYDHNSSRHMILFVCDLTLAVAEQTRLEIDVGGCQRRGKTSLR